MNDIEVIWARHGWALARRMLALADELEPAAAGMVRAVLNCDYDPLPAVRPQLGDPPTVRPSVPQGSEGS